jgi:hypothetical protein
MLNALAINVEKVATDLRNYRIRNVLLASRKKDASDRLRNSTAQLEEELDKSIKCKHVIDSLLEQAECSI